MTELPPQLAEAAAEQLMATPRAERPALLATLVQAHPEHAAALSDLCTQIGGAEQLLGATYPAPDAPLAGLGGYTVERRLGEGAFGTVYLCTQEAPVRRQVAVKVLRPGAGDRNTLRRFAAERQVLASFSHPAITTVFDAGELPDGRPYFSMEYAPGLPITRYAERHGLACDARLRLFAAVCRGVAHAHLRGVVHRDLKPANVLVVDTPEGPQPKVIDFGIARALATPVDDAEPRTDAGRVIGTPGYMSPEQAAGLSHQVDQRADVFGLGVLLYELLTGTLPWPRGAAATDRDPVRPSTRVATAHTAATPAPEPRVRAADLRGDLDWILFKALARAPEERYPTVAELLADVERHRDGQPVSVGPPTVRYRLRKLFRRHPVASTGVGVALLVVTTLALTAWSLSDRAARSDQVRLAAVADAVRQLRQRAEAASAEDLPDRLVRALQDDALALHDRELRAVAGRDDLEQLRLGLLTELATSCWLLGDYRRAIQLGEEAVALATALEPRTPGKAPRWQRALALREIGRSHFRLGEFAAARDASGAAAALFEQQSATDPDQAAMPWSGALVELSAACRRLGDASGDDRAHDQALPVLQGFLARHPADAEAQRNLVRWHCGLANQRIQRGELTAAAAALAQADDLVRTLAQIGNEERALVSQRRAKLCVARGESAAAITHGERALALLATELRQHRDRSGLQTSVVALHGLLFEQYRRTGDAAAAQAQIDALLAPTAPVGSRAARQAGADVLVGMARDLMEEPSWAAFERAEAILARAAAWLDATTDDAVDTAALRAETRTTLAHVRAQLHRPPPVAQWDQLVVQAEAAGQTAWAATARLHAGEQRVAQLDLDGARRDLQAVRDNKAASREAVARLALAIELQAGDPARIGRAARALTTMPASLGGRLAAAIGYTTAAQRARAAGDRAAAADHGQAAATLCAQLQQAAAADWLQLLLSAWADLCQAELSDEATDAATLRTRGLQQLDLVRPRTPAEHWHEALWCAAQVAQLRAGLDQPPDPEARARLEALARLPRAPADAVALCSACAATGATGRGVALLALRQALAAGLQGQGWLRQRPDLAPLRSDPEFAALLARVPP